jgi:MinD-like ATPase involved in chromosome partitioning or flagellar assembly
MEAHKIIAVYGNGGSYKTSTAAALARRIAEIDAGADVILAGLDCTKPLLPLLFPNKKGGGAVKTSLGKLLANERLDQDAIVAQTEMLGKIGILGYNAGENINSHAFPADGRIDDFYLQLRHLANYTIVDCTSDVMANKLTAKALINADSVLWLVSCDLNGLVFVQSQETLLLGRQYGYANYVRALTVSGKFRQDEESMKNAVTKIACTIPFSGEIAEAWNSGKAHLKTSDKAYEQAITELAELLTERGETNGSEEYDEEFE